MKSALVKVFEAILIPYSFDVTSIKSEFYTAVVISTASNTTDSQRFIFLRTIFLDLYIGFMGNYLSGKIIYYSAID